MRDASFPIPYVASLSERLRLVSLIAGVTVRSHVEATVQDVHNNRPVAASLRIPVAGCRVVRQIDIRKGERPPEGAPKAKIILKAFICWDHEFNRWHVFVELPDENYWEQKLNTEKKDGADQADV